MRKEYRSSNVRFCMDDENQRRTWEYLQSITRKEGSYGKILSDAFVQILDGNHAIEQEALQQNLSECVTEQIADCILIMKNGELIQEGTEKEITDKVEGCVWKCIVSEKEAGQITSSFIVSNMRSSGENVELRIVSERQPVADAENVESTLEDAYLYHTQITGGEKSATL